MSKRFESLPEAQHQMILSLMNWYVPLQRGAPRTDLRRIWNSIFYILIYGARWEEFPKSPLFAHRATAHQRIVYWQKIGVYDRPFKKGRSMRKNRSICSIGK